MKKIIANRYFLVFSLIIPVALLLLFTACLKDGIATGEDVSISTAETASGSESSSTGNAEAAESASGDVSAETENTGNNEGSAAGNNQQEEDPGEKKDNDIIVFEGTEINENHGIMVLEVNIKTGTVTGVFQMGFMSFDMSGNSTSLGNYVLTGKIDGNLDPDTFSIDGFLTGTAVADKNSKGFSDYKVNYEMNAQMQDDYSRIKGHFVTKSTDNYEFFLKKK